MIMKCERLCPSLVMESWSVLSTQIGGAVPVLVQCLRSGRARGVSSSPKAGEDPCSSLKMSGRQDEVSLVQPSLLLYSELQQNG